MAIFMTADISGDERSIVLGLLLGRCDTAMSSAGMLIWPLAHVESLQLIRQYLLGKCHA